MLVLRMYDCTHAYTAQGQELDSTLQGDVAREGLAKNYRNGAALTDEQV